MASGLLALLDDVAALVKVSAASLDDVPTQVAKTTGKVSGIVIDDTAVTPKYVVGLDPKRELSIIFQIAKKSIINKVIFLGPAALLLGYFAPAVIPYLLMVGGAYLCFEGYEKVHSIFSKSAHGTEEQSAGDMDVITPEELEKKRVGSAVRTDFILSSEIMAIAYSTVNESPLVTQIVVLFTVAIFITVAVYGFVAIIVKADDIGIHMTKEKFGPTTRKIGRGIVKSMPGFLVILGYVGTAAMLWVGAEIIAHGIPFFHHSIEALEHSLSNIPFLAWVVKVVVLAFGGVVLGAVIAQVITLGKKLFKRPAEKTS